MDKWMLPSVEQFAAFLDGNLSQDEMQQISRLAERNESLHQLLDASDMIESTVSGYTESDLQLPPELVGLDFEIPALSGECAFQDVELSPDMFDNGLVADVAACSDEHMSLFSDSNYAGHTTLGEENDDYSALAASDGGGLDGNDDSLDIMDEIF